MALSNVSWKGMKALEVMSNTLPDRLGGQKLRNAYKFALKPTLDEMRNNLDSHVKTGALWESVGISVTSKATLGQVAGVVGPRRKKNTFNMAGWGAFLIEVGVKPHVIKSETGKSMPIYSTKGFTGRYAKEMFHSGSPGYKPFQKGIDSTWRLVAGRVSDKVAGMMRDEIQTIWRQFGEVVTKTEL